MRNRRGEQGAEHRLPPRPPRLRRLTLWEDRIGLGHVGHSVSEWERASSDVLGDEKSHVEMTAKGRGGQWILDD